MSVDYPFTDWNVYPFHFSDGDNWSTDDTKKCISLLRDEILPNCNQFSYGQVESPYGTGQFLHNLHEVFSVDDEKLCTSEMENREAILSAIKDFFSKGR